MRCFFRGSFLLFYLCLLTYFVCVCHTVLPVPCSLLVICWKRADLLALSCMLCFCVFFPPTFPFCLGHQLWYLFVSIPDVCRLPYHDVCLWYNIRAYVFQRELSIIDFTLNYPPIRNNLTSAILLSMFIETDYLNYPPIRNNLTSASLLSMISEMDFNLVGYESHDRAALPCRICRARNTFFLSRSTKRCNSIFFLLCHLQIVLLTIANTKIHYFFTGIMILMEIWHVSGVWKPMPRRAVPGHLR